MDLEKYKPNREFLLYKTANGDVKVDVLLQNETIWLQQKKIAELFDVQRPAITKHLKNIFDSGELDEKVVCSILELTTQHGAIKGKEQIKFTKYYNLDAIIAVGYRANSNRATQFRIWATSVLKEFIIKGYTMDVERLKNPQPIFGQDYFKEQLEKIRDIRSSERRLYQQITDIYSECSIDYDVNSETTRIFFATVQNKLHWAITGKTAAEIIIGKNHKQAILTVNDRASGVLKMKKVKSKESEVVTNAIIEILDDWIPYIHTMTADNGKEFAGHEVVATDLDIDYYFAHPYHSWERGSNENLNGLVRQYFPKGSDFSSISDDDVIRVQEKLNNRPRKRFGYKSPIFVMNNLLFNQKVAFVT